MGMSLGPLMFVTLFLSAFLSICPDRKGWPRLRQGSSQCLPSRPTGGPSQLTRRKPWVPRSPAVGGRGKEALRMRGWSQLSSPRPSGDTLDLSPHPGGCFLILLGNSGAGPGGQTWTS